MALNREAKAAIIEDVTAQMATAEAIVIAEYRGMDVATLTQLRRNAREGQVYLRVLKNTLVRRVFEGTAFEGLNDKLVGPLIYGISSDPVAVAKVMHTFAKDNDKLVIKAGSLPNQVIDVEGIKALASLPSREELLAKLLGTMQAPVAKFVQTANEIPTKFVRGLAAVRDSKEAA